VRRLRILAARYPHSALVRLELGLALAFTGPQRTRRVPGTSAAGAAGFAVGRARGGPAASEHAAGLPPFVPSFARRARRRSGTSLRGIVFQQALRPVSAEGSSPPPPEPRRTTPRR
jgi:hypothetical protein